VLSASLVIGLRRSDKEVRCTSLSAQQGPERAADTLAAGTSTK
jgi:hypothetical protein